MLPHRKTHTLALGLLAIDLPILVAVAVAGAWYGFTDVSTAVMDWRLAHPVSFLPSALLLVWIVRKRRRA